MVYQPKDPLGYKKLLTWKQAGEIYHKTKDFTKKYLNRTTDRRLIAHMDDSARSVQRNIEEGYKRATTKEYVEFLGFSRASLEELKGDVEELKREWKEGVRWVDKGKIEELLDLIYGEDCMMGRQIASLERKMVEEKTLPQKEMIMRSWKLDKLREKKFWRSIKDKFGLEKDEKGRIRKNDDEKE
ncbi:MAG: four helix bundle protein [Candidatus Omnitrophica bacterium]|nr:four helix bundle protein [Candidatus Omnitrophota bacterium]